MCKKCGIVKSYKEYYKHTKTLDKLYRYCKKCHNKMTKKSYNKDNQYRMRLKREYNVSLEEYNILLKTHNNSCAICQKNQNELNQRLRLDHCHSTGKVRGLLCDSCNVGLGRFRDNPVFLKSAILYLEKTKNDK